MKPIFYKGVDIRTPSWDHHPEKSKTNNTAWRKCLFIQFQDLDGNVYEVLPKWKDLNEINIYREEIEKLNSRLAKEQYKKNSEVKPNE